MYTLKAVKLIIWFWCCLLLSTYARHRRGRNDIPKHGDWNETRKKLINKIENYRDRKIPKSRRNLVIFHVAETEGKRLSSQDVPTNNLKIFSSSIRTHYDGSVQDAFYLFNVMQGNGSPLKRYVPVHHPNVGVIDWNHGSEFIEMHMYALNLLGKDIVMSFSAVFFLSSDVRGPLVQRNNGEWLVEFRKLLDANNVGMVGPTFSCENSPHVQTHFFGWRSELIPKLWENTEEVYNPAENLGNSDFVRSAGYNLSSVLYDRRYKQPYFNGRCALGCGSQMQPTQNPISWCNLLPNEIIFVDWGGEPVRALGYLCFVSIKMMRKILADFADNNPEAELIIPETLVGGNLHELYKEFAEEMYKDRIRPRPLLLTHPSNDATSSSSAVSSTSSRKRHNRASNSHHYSYSLFGGSSEKKKVQHNTGTALAETTTTTIAFNESMPQVCFLVRTAFMHDSSEEMRSKSMFEDVDIEGFITSLLRQTNPFWMAYFFVTDTNPFDQRLKEIVSAYQDPRLVFAPIPKKYKIPFSVTDAGYTTTDYLLGKLMTKSECKWISATNADNIYGSEVVHNVLNAPPLPISKKTPDMLLNPIDSRNFQAADYIERRDLTKGFGVEQTWTDYCTGLEATLLFNSYTYTIQPRPELGKVDLASVFYLRSSLAKENMYFSNFTDPTHYPCLGCQDGYLCEYLAKNRRWTYSRLPIDGLKSIIFHGPSPTWCIAEGNVWFDYPAVNKVGCISQKTVRMLSYHNPKYYDWIHMNFKANKVCLRLSKTGFFSETST